MKNSSTRQFQTLQSSYPMLLYCCLFQHTTSLLSHQDTAVNCSTFCTAWYSSCLHILPCSTLTSETIYFDPSRISFILPQKKYHKLVEIFSLLSIILKFHPDLPQSTECLRANRTLDKPGFANLLSVTNNPIMLIWLSDFKFQEI